MDELIATELAKEEQTEFHKGLLKHVKGLVDQSRQHMGHYYSIWDHNDEVYQGVKSADKSDGEARNRGEPEKMIVPLTYAQIQTYIAFCVSLYTQRQRVFELVGTGEEDHKAAKVGEALIDRDLTWNVFPVRLYQSQLDIARYGVGIVKIGWIRDVQMVEKAVEMPPPTLFGIPIGMARTEMVKEEVARYLGNKLINVSPYNFFPDVRLPLCRFQEGEFVASEDVYTQTQLRRMERNGEIAGVEWIKPQATTNTMSVSRRLSRRSDRQPMTVSKETVGNSKSAGVSVLTEVQVSLVPKEFLIDDKPIGEEDYPVKWNIWYVNDNRVVKAEPMGYTHDQYTYAVGEYSPDIQNLVNPGLADNVDKLQDVVSWLINSHITNVRKVIGDKLIVDPSGVEMKDLTERRPVIRLRPDAARTGVDKWVKQLQVVDVTATHMRDAQELHSLVQLTSGINDNALGQYHIGRRSATEARNVNSATAARLKIGALMLFRQMYEPMARQMLSNHQQGLDLPTFIKVMGELGDPTAYMRFTKVTRTDLIGNYDFEVFDGTTASERSVQAQALQDFLTEYLKNPALIPLLMYDPQKLVEEWLELRGIRNPKRFLLDPARMQQLLVDQQIWGAVTQPQNGQSGQQQSGVPSNGAGAGPATNGRPNVAAPSNSSRRPGGPVASKGPGN